MVAGGAFAQTKPKTLKELVAEEKARKEAEKAAEESKVESRKTANAQSDSSNDAQTPEEVADIVTETDSAIWAPTKVKQLGAQNFGDLTLPRSSMDLQDPNNITTTVEYQPETGTYILHTRIGDTDVTTPYMLTQEEYNHYAERQIMHSYWQKKISEVEHNNERKFDITDMKFNIGPADKVFGPGGVQLKMQGSAELLFGFKHQYIANPSLTVRARNNNIF
ncbi:MAG: hypothetical protein J5704_03530, partial [Paludibacteraceae bacterium]|nr:hypothetical protein [Paludibacteraceae bacterium]